MTNPQFEQAVARAQGKVFDGEASELDKILAITGYASGRTVAAINDLSRQVESLGRKIDTLSEKIAPPPPKGAGERARDITIKFGAPIGLGMLLVQIIDKILGRF